MANKMNTRLPYSRQMMADVLASMSPLPDIQFVSVKNWHREFSKRTGSQQTKVAYARIMAQFCHWTGRDPDTSIMEAKAQLDLGTDAGKVYAETLVTEYFNYMEQTLGYARKTCSVQYGALRGFYRYNLVPFYGKSPQSWSETRTRLDLFKENVRAVLKAADLRGRWIILGLIFILPLVHILVAWALSKFRHSLT